MKLVVQLEMAQGERAGVESTQSTENQQCAPTAPGIANAILDGRRERGAPP
jgi:hypothetical protein